MRSKEIESIISVANIHEERINSALDRIADKFPLDADKVNSLKIEDLFAIEMLTSRFSKLQDYIGNTLFDVFFEIEGENTQTWTMIDKLNKLEKLGLIDDAHIWRDIRKSRNFLTHEYPNEPEIIAISLNKIYSLVPDLMQIKNSILNKIQAENT